MHDTILLNKISEAVKQVCEVSNIKKVNTLAVVVNHKSHVNEHNLYEHLQNAEGDLIGLWTEIKIEREDIQDQTAILHSLKGEKGEE
jgi:Zn finger protein HypA/HybF involved in hydrogenase expression